MKLKNVVFFPTNWRRHLLFFPLSAIFLFFFFCALVFCVKVCVTYPFIFELFLEFLVNPFSLFTFLSRKNQPRNLHFLFLFSPFSVSHFFFQHFSWFSIITFSLITFSFHPFVHPFLLFSPFSFLSFLHSFLISLSQCFLNFFSIAVVAYSLFVVTHFSSVSLFWSWSLCFLASSHVFSRLCFFTKKKSKFSVVNFLKIKLCLYFLNPPVICVKSRVFLLLASSFFLVCSMFSVFAILHRDFSWSSLLFWFSFINLFLGLFKKSLCFPDKRSKISFFFLFSFWKKSLLFFFLEISFLQYICFFMRDLENILSFLCFQSLFLWNYFVSLCFCPKEKWLILFTFSLHSSSSSSWFVLSSCVLSLCLLSLLLLFQLTKIWFKKKLVFYYSSSHNFPEKMTKT